MTAAISSWNQSLFLWLNHACAALPDWLWSSLTITGHTSMVFALFGLFLLPKFSNSRIITGLFAAAVCGGIVSYAVKESFKTMRPPAVLAPEQFHLIGHKLELVSFPSGHTLTAFATLALLIFGLQLRGWRLVSALVFASLIGLSRIAVGAHWPLDVLGGAGLGWLCGFCGWLTAKWLYQKNWTQNPTYLLMQALMIGLVSASVLMTEMGYSQAKIWQVLTAIIGVVCSTYYYLSLKFVKHRKKD